LAEALGSHLETLQAELPAEASLEAVEVAPDTD
jgi:hypothetical protein